MKKRKHKKTLVLQEFIYLMVGKTGIDDHYFVLRSNSLQIRKKGGIQLKDVSTTGQATLPENDKDISFPNFIALESTVLSDKRLNKSAKLLYGYICGLSNNKYGGCTAGNQYLQAVNEFSKSQLYYYLEILKKFNYIIINRKNKLRIITPTINRFMKLRQQGRINFDNFDDDEYDWLNE